MTTQEKKRKRALRKYVTLPTIPITMVSREHRMSLTSEDTRQLEQAAPKQDVRCWHLTDDSASPAANVCTSAAVAEVA